MTILYEVRATSQRVTYPIKLVTADQLHYYTGFQSVYGYPEETAEVIRQQQGTFGLEGLPLYTEVLFLDFDDKPESVVECQEKLVEWNVAFDMYDTGGRGHHFHVKTQPEMGPNVAIKHKAFVKEYFPDADSSLYKTSGVIRLPNSFHSKHPGKFKKLVFSNTGQPLVVPEVTHQAAPLPSGVFDLDDDAARRLDYLVMMTVPKSTAGRNTHAYKIACACRDSGMSAQEASVLISAWNKTNCLPPLKQAEIFTTTSSAYRRIKNANKMA